MANPGLPKYVDSVFSPIFPSEAERRKVLKLSITAASRGGTGCRDPAAQLWNLFPFTFAAALNLILTPLTRAGSRQIPEDCGSLILKILLLENHDLNFTKTYFLERNL